jgi:hypothetical protein
MNSAVGFFISLPTVGKLITLQPYSSPASSALEKRHRQIHGQPTAARETQGAKPSAQTADYGC